MGGFLRNMAPFAAVLQGQNATDYARQQAQQQQITDQLQRALLMGKLRDMNDQQAAMGRQPKDVQDRLNLGETMADVDKRQTAKGRIANWKKDIGAALLDPNRPMDERQKLLGIYANVNDDSDPADIEKQLKDFAGIGEKPPVQPFRTFTADGKVNAFEGYNPDGTPKISSMGSAPASTKEARHYYEAADPNTGASMVHERIEGADGHLISDTPIAAGKLGMMQQNQLQAVASSKELAQGLTNDYAKFKPKYDKNGGTWLLHQWSLYNPTINPGGIRGEPDPDAAQWFSHVGQIKTGLLQAAAGNTRNLKLVNELFGSHVPSEWQSPDGVMQRIQAFQKDGRFDAIRNSILPPMSSATGAGGGGDMGPAAGAGAADAGKFKGTWAPDGREIWVRPDGSKYLK